MRGRKTSFAIGLVGEEAPAPVTNGTPKASKAKVEQANDDADDEQERDKNVPVLYDVADVVWVKMGGHPW